jgi:hypothetical protein
MVLSAVSTRVACSQKGDYADRDCHRRIGIDMKRAAWPGGSLPRSRRPTIELAWPTRDIKFKTDEPGRLTLGKLRISRCCQVTRIVRPFAAFAYEHARYCGRFEGHVWGNVAGQ